ncbi:MAG: tyrosine-type recombinase/integrase [Acidimicrobiales bacterium]
MRGSMREKGPKGTWELRIFLGRDGDGHVRHRSVSFHGGKRAAERELARLVAEAEAATEPVVSPTPKWGPGTTINDAIEGWRDNGWDDLSPNTVRGYEGVWRRHVRDSIGKRRIATLSPYDIEQYFRQLKAAGAGKTTVRLARALLHRSCRLARKWSGNTLPNPVSDTDMPVWSKDEGPVHVRAPEPAEVRALLRAARAVDQRVAGLVRLVAATGMRRGEACALRWDDIESAGGLVRIDEGVIGVNGAAAARSTKTFAGVRRVAVDRDTVAGLATLRKSQEELAAACGLALSARAFVFSFEPGGAVPPHPDSMSHAFAKVRSAAGVAADLHLHSLRHFQATVLDPVISEAQKQARMAWATVQMARHYTDGVPEEDRRAAEHVGRILADEQKG